MFAKEESVAKQRNDRSLNVHYKGVFSIIFRTLYSTIYGINFRTLFPRINYTESSHVKITLKTLTVFYLL
eukprot:UN11250